MAAEEKPWTFDRCGGHLAVDFANTVSRRHTNAPIERLTSYDRLASFAEQSGVLRPAESARLRAAGRRRPAEANRVLADAVALREALYRIFANGAEGRSPESADVEVVNERLGRLRLGDSLEWEWSAEKGGLDGFLGPIVRAAATLLTSPDRERVRMCEADECVWLLFDSSKNRSRRWCDMKQCGNRMKARRFHARHRKSQARA